LNAILRPNEAHRNEIRSHPLGVQSSAWPASQAAALGYLVLGQSSHDAHRRPTFLVGPGGQLGPHQLDRRQAQRGQQ